MTGPFRYRVITADRREEFVGKGHKQRHFFPHTLHFLPKAGPGALRLSVSMCGKRDPNAQWEILLHGVSPQIDDFPRDLFFDNDIVWHKRQYGMPGHIAFAFLVVDGDRMFGINYVSDLVQRIARRREAKTRIEKIFDGWIYMLLNGVLGFAAEMEARTFYSPSAELVMENSRRAGPELFQRVYDRTLLKLFEARREGAWWAIDVRQALRRVVIPVTCVENRPSVSTVCLTYEVTALARDEPSWPGDPPGGFELSSLEIATHLERKMGLPGTYVAPRDLFADVKKLVATERACLAFGASETGSSDRGQLQRELERCRRVSSRTKGYRLPDGRLPGASEAFDLCFHKFDWVLVDHLKARKQTPHLEAGMVRIPNVITDHDLQPASCDPWVERALKAIRPGHPVTFSLGWNWWSLADERRQNILERIVSTSELKTCDQLADEWVLSHAI